MIFDGLIREALLLVLLCSAVPLVCSTAAGLLIACLQTLTSIQEQSVSYLVKFVTLASVLWYAGGWLGPKLVTFFAETFSALHLLNRIS